MAISWLSALKLVPWSDVISNAPLVADGAKKLWGAVVKPGTPPESDPAAAATATDSELPQMAQLQAEVAGLRGEVSDLHRQMVDSSALIKALAEQNAQLVAQVQSTRVRLRWLAALAGLAMLLAGASLWYGLTAAVGRG
jgi:predicted ATP-grasp superfamily ATP-dependent carboligase